MKIHITKCDNQYRADLLDIPGSPSVGIGATKHEAVASLFLNNICESGNKWVRFVELIKLEITEEVIDG